MNEIRSGVDGDASLLADKQAFSEFMDRVNERFVFVNWFIMVGTSVSRRTQESSKRFISPKSKCVLLSTNLSLHAHARLLRPSIDSAAFFWADASLHRQRVSSETLKTTPRKARKNQGTYMYHHLTATSRWHRQHHPSNPSTLTSAARRDGLQQSPPISRLCRRVLSLLCHRDGTTASPTTSPTPDTPRNLNNPRVDLERTGPALTSAMTPATKTRAAVRGPGHRSLCSIGSTGLMVLNSRRRVLLGNKMKTRTTKHRCCRVVIWPAQICFRFVRSVSRAR